MNNQAAASSSAPKPHRRAADWQEGKTRPRIKTDAKRAKDYRQTNAAALEAIRRALKLPKESVPKVLSIAAARFENAGPDNPVLDFDCAAEAYLRELTWQVGSAVPVRHYWNQMLEVVATHAPQLASEFAKNHSQDFRWCLTGHIHRLRLEYDQRPDAVEFIEIWQREGGQRVFVAVRHDGKRYQLDRSDFPRFGPWICPAGGRYPGAKTGDVKGLKDIGEADQFNIRALAALRAATFHLTTDTALATEDTVLNVAPPVGLSAVSGRLAFLGLQPKQKFVRS